MVQHKRVQAESKPGAALHLCTPLEVQRRPVQVRATGRHARSFADHRAVLGGADNQVKCFSPSATSSAARFTAIVQADRHASMQAQPFGLFEPARDKYYSSSTYRSSTDLFLQNQPDFLYSSSIMEFDWPIPAAWMNPAERLRHLHRRYDSWKNTGRESIMVESGVRYPACPGTSVDDSGRDRQSDEHA